MAAWLLRDGEVLAALEVIPSRQGWGASLAGGRTGIAGALLMYGARTVHTVGARFGVDVAYCSVDRPPEAADGVASVEMITIVDSTSMAPYRLGRPRPRAHCVLVAERGAFERWRLRAGDRLELR